MTTMEVMEQLLRLETEMLVLYAKIGEFEARLEILEKARDQGMARSAAPASEAASGRRACAA